MNRQRTHAPGFTLVELLTVIAIIGILAGLVATMLPRALERAKIANVEGTIKNLETAFVSYYTENNSYPPGYAYLNDGAVGKPLNEIDLPAVGDTRPTDHDYNLLPYTAYLKIHNQTDNYDPFSEGFGVDANGNTRVDLLEFIPVGRASGPSGTSFSQSFLYSGPNSSPGPPPTEEQLQLNLDLRPLIYVPVNLRQVERFQEFWWSQNAVDPRPREGDALPATLTDMSFPPPKYDAYVLISMGPAGNTFRLLDLFEAGEGGTIPASYLAAFPPEYAYHIMGIIAYHMASRDANQNGELDFEFRARTRRDEADYVVNGVFVNQLPSARAPNGAGPIIFKSR